MNTNSQRKLKDLKFGNYYEQKVLKFLNDDGCYKDNSGPLKFYKNPFNVMDMCNDTNILELKTRRIFFNQYPDLMIGLNKIEEAEKFSSDTKKYTMLFLLKDGLYGWRYSPDKKYDIKMGGRCDRGVDERKLCAFLFTKDMFLISTDINSIS
tara:strand:- start:1100 stop:1555 length:456 start_codon:yes stop_codon:yes gene_type:complete